MTSHLKSHLIHFSDLSSNDAEVDGAAEAVKRELDEEVKAYEAVEAKREPRYHPRGREFEDEEGEADEAVEEAREFENSEVEAYQAVMRAVREFEDKVEEVKTEEKKEEVEEAKREPKKKRKGRGKREFEDEDEV